MQWLDQIVDEALAKHPEGEIIVSSGVSPSGTYHLGTLREVLSAEVIAFEINRRGRQARHLHIVDDLDVFRKVPESVPPEFEKYLGRPLCDVPSPDDKHDSYADYFLADLLDAGKKLSLTMEVVRSHQKYRAGFFTTAIEKALKSASRIRGILAEVSGRKLDEQWSPVQVMEEGYLKNRQFVSIDQKAKTIVYKDADGQDQSIDYSKGAVKLNWRVDWPARWWLLKVDVEPFGRDHATKGGSYETGSAIVEEIFEAKPPLPVPYDFINRTGDTKKMSKSAGGNITAAELLLVLPPEVVWYFILRFPPSKLLFFDEGPTMMRLIDEFSELLAKNNKTESEQKLVELCLRGNEPTISRVPFSHLVASYQAALKNVDETLKVLARTEYKKVVAEDEATIRRELAYIDEWLKSWAPDDMKFELSSKPPKKLEATDQKFLKELADKIAKAPDDADGEWFHNVIYEIDNGLEPKQKFAVIYQALIGQEKGPRAGWFLSILPHDWLLKRLRLKA